MTIVALGNKTGKKKAFFTKGTLFKDLARIRAITTERAIMSGTDTAVKIMVFLIASRKNSDLNRFTKLSKPTHFLLKASFVKA